MDKDDKVDSPLNDVLSPIFGEHYQGKVIGKPETNAIVGEHDIGVAVTLEDHIEQELLVKQTQEKLAEYEKTAEINEDILVKYQAEKKQAELLDNLPSHNFNTQFLQNDVSDILSYSETIENTTISEIINNILKEEESQDN